MYKIIDHGNRKIEIQEHFSRPMVYLDHWALNDIALAPELRDKFISAMNTKGGTLRLSVANIAELSSQTDCGQIQCILDMIRSIEDCGLINNDPREVIKKEDILITDPKDITEVNNPSAELEIIAAYLLAQNFPSTWHVSDILKSAIDEPSSKQLYNNNDKFLADMRHLLEIGRNDPECLKRSKSRFEKLKKKGLKYECATRELFNLSLDFIVRNKNMKMDKYSEWSDIFHLIVPVAYCDIVMLDRRWIDFIKQTGFAYPHISMTFSKRSLDSLFENIENWN